MLARSVVCMLPSWAIMRRPKALSGEAHGATAAATERSKREEEDDWGVRGRRALRI